MEDVGESNSGSVAVVTTGTSTQGKQGGKGDRGKKMFPCMACGGKYNFKERPEWKKAQALIKGDTHQEVYCMNRVPLNHAFTFWMC